jgi:hypothetical protein
MVGIDPLEHTIPSQRFLLKKYISGLPNSNMHVLALFCASIALPYVFAVPNALVSRQTTGSPGGVYTCTEQHWKGMAKTPTHVFNHH